MRIDPSRLTGSLLFSLAAMLIVYQAYISFSFGIIVKPMSRDLGLAIELGAVISAAFLIASAMLQIPIGIAIDRYSTTRIVAVAVAVCASGGLLLSFADDASMAIASRLLMGAGAAFGLVGALKLLSLAVSGGRFAVAVGSWHVLHSFIVAGLVLLTFDLGLEEDWRGLMTTLAAIGFFIAALLWFAPKPPAVAGDPFATDTRPPLRETLRNRQVVLAAVFFSLTFGAFVAYTDLWVIPQQRAWGHSAVMTAAIAGMLPIGLGCGSFVAGLTVDIFHRPRTIAAAMSVLGLIASLDVLFGPRVPGWEAMIVVFLFGFSCGASTVALGIARAAAPRAIGTAFGLATMLGYLVAAGLQLVTATIIQHLTHDTPLDTLAYGLGLLPVPACFLAALVVLAFIRPPPRPE